MSSKDAVADNTLFGLVLDNILHSLNGGNCFATFKGFVLLHAPIIIGAITFSKGLTAAYLKPLAMLGNIYLSMLATLATAPIPLPATFNPVLTTGLAPNLYASCAPLAKRGNPPPINVPSLANLSLFLAVANASSLPVKPLVDSGLLILPALISVKGILYSIP